MSANHKDKRTKGQILKLLDRAIEQEERLVEKIKSLETQLTDCRKKADDPRSELAEEALAGSKVSFRIDFYRTAAKSPQKGIIEHLPTRQNKAFEGEGIEIIRHFIGRFLNEEKGKKKKDTADKRTDPEMRQVAEPVVMDPAEMEAEPVVMDPAKTEEEPGIMESREELVEAAKIEKTLETGPKSAVAIAENIPAQEYPPVEKTPEEAKRNVPVSMWESKGSSLLQRIKAEIASENQGGRLVVEKFRSKFPETQQALPQSKNLAGTTNPVHTAQKTAMPAVAVPPAEVKDESLETGSHSRLIERLREKYGTLS